MTDEPVEKRGPGRPRKSLPVGDQIKAEVAAASGLVRVEITSEKNAFGFDGRKYLHKSTPTVSEAQAAEWESHGRAKRL